VLKQPGERHCAIGIPSYILTKLHVSHKDGLIKTNHDVSKSACGYHIGFIECGNCRHPILFIISILIDNDSFLESLISIDNGGALKRCLHLALPTKRFL